MSDAPPANLPAEMQLLGAILIDSRVLHVVTPKLNAEDFYRDAHRKLYTALQGMVSGQIDLTTAVSELRRLGWLEAVGGPAYVSSLLDGSPRGQNVEAYAALIREKALLRGVLGMADKATQAAYSGVETAPAVIDRAVADLLTLSRLASGEGFLSAAKIMPSVIDSWEQLSKPDSPAWGPKTGLNSLDRVLRGLRPRLYIIAARPSVGKTSLAVNIAVNIAKGGHAVGFFSLEMTREELLTQAVCAEAGVNIEEVTEGKVNQSDWARVSEAWGTLAAMPLFVDDLPDLTVVSLRAKCRQLQIDHPNLAVVFVDYLQLMQDVKTSKRERNRNEIVGDISREMKRLTKELNVAIVALAQLNRSPEARPDGRPMLGDLRESGNLEQDADAVVLIHRPDMHPRKKKKRSTSDLVDEELEKGVAELIVAKQRGGKSGSVKVLFRAEYTRFENLSL